MLHLLDSTGLKKNKDITDRQSDCLLSGGFGNMRVLQINSVCGVGSTGRIATDIYSALQKNGHDSMIAYGRGTAPAGINTLKIGNKIDNLVQVVETRIFDNHGFGSIQSTKKLIKKIVVYNPDVIHLHNIHGYYINIKILFDYLKKIKKPVIWTLHDCWSFTGHCAYFDIVNCDRWKYGCYQCPNKGNYPKSSLFDFSKSNYIKKRKLFNGVDSLQIVTPSIWLAELVEQSFLKEYPVQVINNGINLEVYKPSESDFRDTNQLQDKFIILGVANIWDERKGYQYFIELSKKVDDNTTIILIGLSEQQCKNLPQNIIGIRKTNNIEDLAKIYSTADVFFNPTREEVFGLVNIEALACGTPVITFKTGGSPECIDTQTGYVINVGDWEATMYALKKIRNGSIGPQCCIERAKLFNKEDVCQKYIGLYENSIRKER